jgi:peptide deformylase
MAVFEIVTYPNPLLYEVSKKVNEIDEEIITLVGNMVETMYAVEGVGLAAVQIGFLKRIFVVDPTFAGGTKQDPALVFINPEIIHMENEIKEEEGCLSLPGIFIQVKRFANSTIKAQNLEGEFFEMDGENILSRAFQHEMEHLNGKLIIDKIGGLKKKLVLKKLKTD